MTFEEESSGWLSFLTCPGTSLGEQQGSLEQQNPRALGTPVTASSPRTGGRQDKARGNDVEKSQ